MKLDTLLLRNFVSALRSFRVTAVVNLSGRSKTPFRKPSHLCHHGWTLSETKALRKTKLRSCKVGKIFTAVYVFYVTTLRLYISTESWKNVRLEPRRLSASLCMSVIMLLGVTGCVQICRRYSSNKFEIRSWFYYKAVYFCVVKCSLSVIYVSIASLCQPLHPSFIKKIGKISKHRGFIRYLRCW